MMAQYRYYTLHDIQNVVTEQQANRARAKADLFRMVEWVSNLNDVNNIVDSNGYTDNHPMMAIKRYLNPGDKNFSGSDLLGRFRNAARQRRDAALVGITADEQEPGLTKIQIRERAMTQWKTGMTEWLNNQSVEFTERERSILAAEFQIQDYDDNSEHQPSEFALEVQAFLNGDTLIPGLNPLRTIGYNDEENESIEIAANTIFAIDLSGNENQRTE
jgi:hypothetical protein